MSEQNKETETGEKEKKAKNRYPLAGLVVIPAVALCASIIAAGASVLVSYKIDTVDKLARTLNSTTIPGLVSTAESATAGSAPTAESTEPANTIMHDDAVMNIVSDNDGNLALSSDSILIIHNDDASVAIPVSAFTDSEEPVYVEYNSQQNTVKVNGYSIKVTNNPFDSKESVKLSGSNKDVYTTSKAFDQSCGLTIAYEVQPGVEYDVGQLHEIMESAKEFDGKATVTVFGAPLNETWEKSFAINEDVAEFGNGDSSVYLSKYEGTLTGAGMDDELSLADGLDAQHGDLKDEETGLSPYFVSSNDHTFKFLATSDDIMTDMFSENC